MTSSTVNEPLHVAIIGAGITGVNVALGLQAADRDVSYTIYERNPEFREIGAGIGFSPNAERAMKSLNPDVLAAFKESANPNGEDYFQWVDGYKSGELMYKLYVGKDGFQGGRRSDILERWARMLRPDAVQLSKDIDTITEPDPAAPSSKLTLHFKDGTTATADAVIGCDGIRSRVRQLVLSPSATSSPDQQLPAAAHPGYTRKFCFRALAPMAAAVAAIGEYRSTTRFMYNGPGAHVITYPVGKNTLLNILAVISDPSAVWLHQHAHGRHTAPGSKAEAVEAFREWHETVRKIVDLLPEEMDKWGIFDMAEDPAPGYVSSRGRVCVAGDAAHATGPHLGAGGGMGIEDALVLAALLGRVKERGSEGEEKEALVAKALQVYNDVRYERTQKVVQATRAACDLFHWKEDVGRDPGKFGQAITPMFHRIWEYDVDGMVEEALDRLEAKAP